MKRLMTLLAAAVIALGMSAMSSAQGKGKGGAKPATTGVDNAENKANAHGDKGLENAETKQDLHKHKHKSKKHKHSH